MYKIQLLFVEVITLKITQKIIMRNFDSHGRYISKCMTLTLMTRAPCGTSKRRLRCPKRTATDSHYLERESDISNLYASILRRLSF